MPVNIAHNDNKKLPGQHNLDILLQVNVNEKEPQKMPYLNSLQPTIARINNQKLFGGDHAVQTKTVGVQNIATRSSIRKYAYPGQPTAKRTQLVREDKRKA